MSSKKNKSKNLNKYFMSIAMNLAQERNGLTGLNPSVGCLIVKNNKIVSFGQTGFNGRPHAESVAIKNCKRKDLSNSTIYITMEPCTHYGKTPPCSNLIIKSKINVTKYQYHPTISSQWERALINRICWFITKIDSLELVENTPLIETK